MEDVSRVPLPGKAELCQLHNPVNMACCCAKVLGLMVALIVRRTGAALCLDGRVVEFEALPQHSL